MRPVWKKLAEYANREAFSVEDVRDGMARQVDWLSKSLGIPGEEVKTKLKRLLEKHSQEWRSFIDSLGPRSFVAQWVERREAHVPGGVESR